MQSRLRLAAEMFLPFAPFIMRQEHPHGQGILSYDSINTLATEQINPQAAPDPVRQGATPSRAAKMPVAVMSLGQWNYGFAEDFVPDAHILTARMSAGHMNQGHQSPVGIRPNIEKPPAVTYGSLFALGSQTYDRERQ